MRNLWFCLLLLACTHPPQSERGLASEGKVVTTFKELRRRVAQAYHGEVIRIAQSAKFDLTREAPLVIEIPLTLESWPKKNQVQKALFYSAGKPLPMIVVKANEVVINGIKFEGIEIDSKKKEIIELNKKGIKGVYQFPVTRGIEVNGNDVVIKNCEITGFSHAGIFATDVRNLKVLNNSIHHNQRWGLGYGVALNKGAEAYIKGNFFDYNRHAIAGTGHSGQSYEATQNFFGPNHIASPLDMHGGKDRGDGTQVAGRLVHIHENVIKSKGVFAFIHRGIAEDKVIFRNNQIPFKTMDEAIGYYNLRKSQVPPAKFIYTGNFHK